LLGTSVHLQQTTALLLEPLGEDGGTPRSNSTKDLGEVVAWRCLTEVKASQNTSSLGITLASTKRWAFSFSRTPR
jgi:hypothetical protein